VIVPTARSTSHLRVRYADTDAMGVAYYANYFVWFEVARTDLLLGLGWSYREMEAGGVLLPVIETDCRYRRPARYDDELEIRTEGRLMSAVRLEFRYEVFVTGDDTMIASGRTAHAALGRNGRPCRLPARVVEAFS
jgi:acyl-CoA thioester hydrolase